MKLNLMLIDGTCLENIILSTTKENLSIGELKTKEEFYNWLESDGSQRMYFSGKYVQGGISHPKIIKHHQIFEADEAICTLICKCGKVYNYIPRECKVCGTTFVDC
jgi:hypothetical protein